MARRSFELNGSKAEDFGLETEPTSANRRNQMKFQVSFRASLLFITKNSEKGTRAPRKGQTVSQRGGKTVYSFLGHCFGL